MALVDGEEATLKRLRRKGASIALEAANPAYETRIFGPDQVKVQGRLVGLSASPEPALPAGDPPDLQSSSSSALAGDREAPAPPRARSFGCGRAARPRAARENWR